MNVSQLQKAILSLKSWLVTAATKSDRFACASTYVQTPNHRSDFAEISADAPP